jgi:hypothetical protein
MRGAFRTVQKLVARGYQVDRAVSIAAEVHQLSPVKTVILCNLARVK